MPFTTADVATNLGTAVVGDASMAALPRSADHCYLWSAERCTLNAAPSATGELGR